MAQLGLELPEGGDDRQGAPPLVRLLAEPDLTAHARDVQYFDGGTGELVAWVRLTGLAVGPEETAPWNSAIVCRTSGRPAVEFDAHRSPQAVPSVGLPEFPQPGSKEQQHS